MHGKDYITRNDTRLEYERALGSTIEESEKRAKEGASKVVVSAAYWGTYSINGPYHVRTKIFSPNLPLDFFGFPAPFEDVHGHLNDIEGKTRLTCLRSHHGPSPLPFYTLEIRSGLPSAKTLAGVHQYKIFSFLNNSVSRPR